MWFSLFNAVRKLSNARFFWALIIVAIVLLISLVSLSPTVNPILLNTMVGSIILSLLAELIGNLIPRLWRSGTLNPFQYRATEILNQISESFRTLDNSNEKKEASPERYSQIVFHSQNIALVDQLFSGRLPINFSEAVKLFSREEWALILIFSNKSQTIYRTLDNTQYGFTPFSIKEISSLASKVPQYVQILLTLSLSKYFYAVAFAVAQQTLSTSLGLIEANHQRELGDERLRNKALATSRKEPEVYFVVSTTSQVTNLSIDMFRGADDDDLGEVNLFLVHPDILEYAAISELNKEYKVPKACMPVNQFAEDNGDFTIDSLRRVLKILNGVRDTIKYSEENPHVKVHLYFFIDGYPNIRIRLAVKHQYLQVFAGCLDMANNLYRFGVDTADGELVYKYLKAITHQANGENKFCRVKEFDLSWNEYHALENQATRSIFRYLLTHGIDKQKLIDLRPIVFQILSPDKESKIIFQKIISMYDKTDRFIDKLSENSSVE